MIRIISFILLFLFFAGELPELRAQHRPTCATMEHLQRLQKQQPALKNKREELRVRSEKLIREESAFKLSSAVIQIPVVVHVVYRHENENISDAQIRSQIQALTEDFRRRNVDTIQTPKSFRGVATDMGIEFCLAVRDPDDNPSTGITRTQTTVPSFWTDDAIKFTSRGGRDIWDPDHYLNIWVGNVSQAFLGYAQFPGLSARTDGVVIGYQYFGREGAAVAPFNGGRTTTHEVGHWLNLLHLWGDSNCGDDEIEDTPQQKGANYTCPNFPQSTCGNASDMFMNYMDYTDDACMNLFTRGQRDRMRAAIQLARPGLLSSRGCEPVNIPPLDAAVFAIPSPLSFFCQPVFTPAVVLKNTGQSLLTSATISYQVNGGSTSTYRWTGQLNSFETTTVVLPEQQVGPGNHTFTATVSRPNDGEDGNIENNSKTMAFRTIRQEAGQPLPFQEGFENLLFPPPGWEVINPDGRVTWDRTTRAAKSGRASAFVWNFRYVQNGEVDELVLPAVDLTSHFSPRMSFELAYSLFDRQRFSDTLEVLLSTDCGVSFTSIYKKYGTSLTTTLNQVTKDDFSPTAEEWRKEIIDLEPYASYHNVVFKFRNINDYENNLFLDEITIKGIPEIILFPNPTSGQAELQIPANIAPDVEVQILDISGRVVLRKRKADFDGSILHFDLSKEPNGLYLVHVRNGNTVVVRKVLVAK
jgi:hypothetical protein